MKELWLYGSGKRCHILLNLVKNTDYEICGIVDSNATKWGKKLNGITIESPDVLREHSEIYVCVTFYSSLVYEPTWDKLEINYGIPRTRQMSFHDVLLDIYLQHTNKLTYPICGENRKILFDASWGLGHGGVESWLKDMIFWCDQAGWKNFYLLSAKEQKGIKSEVETHIQEFSYEDAMVFSPEYIQKGINFLKENGPCTIVFSRVNELMVSACLLKRNYPEQYKIIMVDHGSSDGMYRDILSYRKMIDKYVCVSQGIRETLVSYGIPEQRVFSMTVPMPYEKTLERTYSMDPGEAIHLGYAGRLEKFEKRMDIMIQLIEELEKRNVKYYLEIAGTGSYYDKLKQFISEKKIENHISLLGWLSREKMSAFWQRQDVALNVSDNEGRPIANMEAMLNGAVPVATETIGVLDDVHDGENGFMVPICDYVGMADKIEYLGKNRTILPKMGKMARKEMILKMDMGKYMSMWEKILKE